MRRQAELSGPIESNHGYLFELAKRCERPVGVSPASHVVVVVASGAFIDFHHRERPGQECRCVFAQPSSTGQTSPLKLIKTNSIGNKLQRLVNLNVNGPNLELCGATRRFIYSHRRQLNRPPPPHCAHLVWSAANCSSSSAALEKNIDEFDYNYVVVLEFLSSFSFLLSFSPPAGLVRCAHSNQP